ncbi:MFS transporter [Actinoplanes siamensis]|uniref:MFS transporter n=1 Tax=Actinoplanes siamensis TaxID=1223317 RepID=A0A919NC44_9ACTN|nr:MFS transporter [Actinoplanes siamensis]GIF08464.1 MFS transporter [Actinoplanes siamensis]
MSFRRTQLSVAALFGALGFQYSTWAARIPALTDRLHLSSAQVGVLLLAAGVGAVLSFPVVPRLMAAYGSRRLAVAAVFVLVAALAGLAVAPDYPLALAVLLVDGVAVGCLNVAMNAQGTALESTFGRTTMAKLHATFSGGIFGGALLASAITSLTGSVPLHFAVAGAVLLTLALAARPALLTRDLPSPPKPAGRRWNRPAAPVLWLGLAMLLATITEGAMTDWSALYLERVAHAADSLLPLGIAVTSGMMVLARLFADGWRDRWGDRTVVVAGGALAGAGLAVGLLAGGAYPALAGFACVGLGMAAVSPCLYMAAAQHGATALTTAAAMSTTGLLAGPPAIGLLAEGAGLTWSMAAVVVTAWLTVLCVLPVRWAPRPPGGAPHEDRDPAALA